MNRLRLIPCAQQQPREQQRCRSKGDGEERADLDCNRDRCQRRQRAPSAAAGKPRAGLGGRRVQRRAAASALAGRVRAGARAARCGCEELKGGTRAAEAGGLKEEKSAQRHASAPVVSGNGADSRFSFAPSFHPRRRGAAGRSTWGVVEERRLQGEQDRRRWSARCLARRAGGGHSFWRAFHKKRNKLAFTPASSSVRARLFSQLQA